MSHYSGKFYCLFFSLLTYMKDGDHEPAFTEEQINKVKSTLQSNLKVWMEKMSDNSSIYLGKHIRSFQ